MLTLRKRIFLYTGIGAGIILLIALVMLLRKDTPFVPDGPISDTPTDTAVEVSDDTFFVPPDLPVASTPEAKPTSPELYAKQLARMFVERFGTYSNQNNNKHISDALLLVTDGMSDWVRTQGQEQSNTYTGVTTHVLTNTIRERGENRFLVGIEAQQETRAADGTEGKRVRPGRVEVVNTDDGWRINGFWWEG